MKKTKPTLALVMIVKNEEAVLDRCLRSVRGIVDEIVIADTGSTDRTKEIAAEHDAKIIDFEWTQDFAAARNAALEEATTDWVLQLDADEELGTGKELLHDLVRDKYYWGYNVRVVNAPDAASADQATQAFLATRLFRRRDDIRYHNIIHEQVNIADPERTGTSDLTIVHFGPSISERTDRPGRNIPLLQKALDQDPDNPYFYAILGNEYFLLKDWAKAKETYERILPRANPSLIYVISMRRNLVLCYFMLGEKQKASGMLRAAQERYPDFTDLFFLEGILAAYERNHRLAIACFTRCLHMGDPPIVYASWGGVGSARARAALQAVVAAMGGRISNEELQDLLSV